MNLFLSILILLSPLSSESDTFELQVKFTGLENNKGQVLMKLVDEKGQKVAGYRLKIQNKEATKVIKLQKGSYAISSFHDENKDEKLNTNSVGVPNEAYGFSNNVRGWFGPPELKDQLFELESDKKIEIELK